MKKEWSRALKEGLFVSLLFSIYSLTGYSGPSGFYSLVWFVGAYVSNLLTIGLVYILVRGLFLKRKLNKENVNGTR